MCCKITSKIKINLFWNFFHSFALSSDSFRETPFKKFSKNVHFSFYAKQCGLFKLHFSSDSNSLCSTFLTVFQPQSIHVSLQYLTEMLLLMLMLMNREYLELFSICSHNIREQPDTYSYWTVTLKKFSKAMYDWNDGIEISRDGEMIFFKAKLKKVLPSSR